jgi:hypothetical protein
MRLTNKQAEKLLEYDGPIQLHQLALNFALTRFKTAYQRNPSAEVVAKCAEDFNALFAKYEDIMRRDYEWIIGLP